jgi:hypothetical protein
MKIKDAVVIDRGFLQSFLDDFNKCMIENGNTKVERKIINNHIQVMNKIIGNSKPLEPIIKDAYNSGMNELNSNIHGLSNYLNDTEI